MSEDQPRYPGHPPYSSEPPSDRSESRRPHQGWNEETDEPPQLPQRPVSVNGVPQYPSTVRTMFILEGSASLKRLFLLSNTHKEHSMDSSTRITTPITFRCQCLWDILIRHKAITHRTTPIRDLHRRRCTGIMGLLILLGIIQFPTDGHL